MADDTDAGLSVRQLLKMVASGDLRAVLYVFGKPDFHIWSRLREFGAHIPDPDLESFKTRLRDILSRRPVLKFQTKLLKSATRKRRSALGSLFCTLLTPPAPQTTP